MIPVALDLDPVGIDSLDPLDIDTLNKRIPSWVETLNKRIPSWAEQKSSADSPIAIADCSTEAGYTLDMNRDGMHPNAAGDHLIANQVGPLLVRYVRDVIAERQRGDLLGPDRSGKGNEELRKIRNL